MTWLQTFAVLCACHALADYPLQGDWLSKAKNHRLNLVPGEMIWPLALACDGKISYNQDQALHIAVMAIIAAGYVVKGSP